MATTEAIEVKCPSCKEATLATIKSADKVIGLGPVVTCQHCGARFQIKRGILHRPAPDSSPLGSLQWPWTPW